MFIICEIKVIYNYKYKSIDNYQTIIKQWHISIYEKKVNKKDNTQ